MNLIGGCAVFIIKSEAVDRADTGSHAYDSAKTGEEAALLLTAGLDSVHRNYLTFYYDFLFLFALLAGLRFGGFR